MCAPDTHPVPHIHRTGRGAGPQANPGRQRVELRGSAEPGAGGLVSVDRSERTGHPESPAEFCSEWGSGLGPRRRRADVQRQQPPLAQQRQQSVRIHRSVHRGEQSPRPVQQQRLWPHLAGECTVWRQRSRLILDPRSDRAATEFIAVGQSPQPPDRWGLCGQPDKQESRHLTVATTAHPWLARRRRGGDGVSRRRYFPLSPPTAPSSRSIRSRGWMVWRRQTRCSRSSVGVGILRTTPSSLGSACS